MHLLLRTWLVRGSFVLMGVLTATPVLAVAFPAQLESYGVLEPDPVVLPLLQHRGVLQLVLGAALVWAGFRTEARVAVAVAAIVSKSGWLTLTLTTPEAREVANPVALVFDPLCIVLLVGFLIGTAVRLDRARPSDAARPPSPARVP